MGEMDSWGGGEDHWEGSLGRVLGTGRGIGKPIGLLIFSPEGRPSGNVYGRLFWETEEVEGVWGANCDNKAKITNKR